jgi:hypothetical protein
MTDSPESAPTAAAPAAAAQADLAFMRTLVQSGGGQFQKTFGQGYLAAGLCYGGELLGACAQGAGLLPMNLPMSLVVHLLPTLVFLVAIFWTTWPTRNAKPSMFGRAMRAVFACIGASYLCLAAVIASVALREHSLATWLIYPCAVYVLQGAAWLIYFNLSRRPWMLIVALGWFACGIAMGWCVTNPAIFLLFAAIGLTVLMVVPGWILARSTQAD